MQKGQDQTASASVPPRSGGGLASLTSLRAIAAIFVFGRHSADFIFRSPNFWLTRPGAVGVSFFFILSGFVLAWSSRPGDSPKQFWRRRAARIYPAYILVLCVAQGSEVLRHKVTILAFLANATLIQSWFPTSSVYFASDMGAWSLGCEAFFYLLFPLVLPRLVRLPARRRWQVAGAAAVFEVVMALATHSSEQASGVALWLVYVLPITRFGEFVIGMTLALAVKEGFRLPVSMRSALVIAGTAYLVACFVPVYLMWVVVTLVPFAILIAVAAVTDRDGRTPRLLRSAWMVRLGHWSYAFYLVHIMVVTIFAHLIGANPGAGREIAATLMALVVATAAAGFVHTYVEAPLERRFRGEREVRRSAEGADPSSVETLNGHTTGQEINGDHHLQRTSAPTSAPEQPATDESRSAPGGPGPGGHPRGPGAHVEAATGPDTALGAAEAQSVHRVVLHQLPVATAPGPAGDDLSDLLHGGRSQLRLPRRGRERPRRGERARVLHRRADREVRSGWRGHGDPVLHASGEGGHLLRRGVTAERAIDPVEGPLALTGPSTLVVIHYYPPHIGGMEEVARAQVSSLAGLGHRVHVLTCAHERRLPANESAAFELRRIKALNFIERRFGVTMPIIGPGGALRVARAVRRAEIVHIHDVFYATSHVAHLAARLLRRPYYLTQHVAMVEHPSRLVMAVQRAMYATVGRSVLRGAERVVVYNSRVRDFVVSRGVEPERVLLHHNGIDGERFTPATAEEKVELRRRHGIRADRPVVVFVGRLVPKKGFDIVVEAASPTGEWTTLIVGEGAGAPPEVPESVHLFGPADRDQIVDLYRMADVFVFPALGEMFTLTMQEAMMAGLPVITTDDPAYDEYGLDRSGIAFVPRDASSFRAAIRSIITNADRAASMGEYSRRIALQRFSWQVNYQAEYALYDISLPPVPTPQGAGLVPSPAG
ncbi:MAG TPA: glycosyltransferase [Acidimicrobiales bacterium]|nr:glycosyltransferase [Acidimicrobiales bacterium]